jgi:hypothetical protein
MSKQHFSKVNIHGRNVPGATMTVIVPTTHGYCERAARAAYPFKDATYHWVNSWEEDDSPSWPSSSSDSSSSSSSDSSSSSSSYSSSSSSGDGITLEGLLALAALGIGGFAAFVAIMTLWVFLPELLLGVGAFAAFKGGKAINNRGFQRNTKIGMITTLAVISTVLPYLGGMEAHKAVEFDRNSYIEEVKQDWKEFNS